jgi:tripartite-type tricarboxylate transporter receptor subunit TctC
MRHVTHSSYFPQRLTLGALVLALVASAVSSASLAQAYPSRPLRWIVPIAPGGGTDLTTRIVAQKFTEFVGYPVVVDNRAGASGNIGAELAARAPADGYTLVTLTASHPAYHALLERAPFDLVRDFEPVTQLTTQPYLLVVHPSIAAKSVAELVAIARGEPAKMHYGSAGIGTLQHLSGVMLGAMGRVEVVHVPYKGGAPALTDLVTGRIQFFFSVMLSSMPHMRAGKLRALGVTSLKRATIFPDVPTIAESGLPGFEVNNWYGVAVPAKTPRAVVERLHADIARALKTDAVRERLAQDGSEAVGETSQKFGELLRADLQRWRKYAAQGGVKPN